MADPLQYQVQAINYKSRGTGGPGLLGSLSGLAGFRTTLLEPPYMELARSTRIFCGAIQLVASGIVPTVDFPTTAAGAGFYNAATAGGRCLVPLYVAACVASGTAAAGLSIQVATSAAPLTSANALTANASNYKIQAVRGAGSSVAFGGAMTLPSSTWTNVAAQESTADTVPGAGLAARLDGMFVVPPTFGFGINILAGTGTSAKFLVSCIWAEMELDLEV